MKGDVTCDMDDHSDSAKVHVQNILISLGSSHGKGGGVGGEILQRCTKILDPPIERDMDFLSPPLIAWQPWILAVFLLTPPNPPPFLFKK